MKKLLLIVLGILLTLAVCVDIYWWIAGWDSQLSFESNRQEWLAHFPAALQNARLITCINIICLGVAIAAFAVCRRYGYRLAALILIIADALLLGWQLFSLL
jgi:hypothetical protein